MKFYDKNQLIYRINKQRRLSFMWQLQQLSQLLVTYACIVQ